MINCVILSTMGNVAKQLKKAFSTVINRMFYGVDGRTGRHPACSLTSVLTTSFGYGCLWSESYGSVLQDNKLFKCNVLPICTCVCIVTLPRKVAKS